MVGAVQRAVHHNKLANIAVRPFLLVPVLFIEFGFFALAGIRQARIDWPRMRSARAENTGDREFKDLRWMTWLMLGASLWVATMMHSKVIQNNDLAFRGVEVAQFVLLLWGAMQLANAEPSLAAAGSAPVRLASPKSAPVGWIAGSLLALGFLTAVGQLAMLRLYLWGSDRYGWTNPVIPASELTPHVGALSYEVRQTYAALGRVLPASAIVNFGANPKLNLQLLYDSRFQQVDGMEPGCGTDFGGSPDQCRSTEEQLAPIYGTPFPPLAGGSQLAAYRNSPADRSRAGGGYLSCARHRRDHSHRRGSGVARRARMGATTGSAVQLRLRCSV